MTASIDNKPYEQAARTFRLQVGCSWLAFAVTQLNMGNLNPLALGLAMQTASKIVILVEKKFSIKPAEVLKLFISGSLITATYSFSNQLDPTIQAVCFLAVLAFDLRRIGLKNGWEVLKGKTQICNHYQPEYELYKHAVTGLKTQVGFSVLAFSATALKIVDLKPLAVGVAANCLAINEFSIVHKLPEVLQIISLGGFCYTVYALTSPFDSKVQTAFFAALLMYSIAAVHPKNVWKELKT